MLFRSGGRQTSYYHRLCTRSGTWERPLCCTNGTRPLYPKKFRRIVGGLQSCANISSGRGSSRSHKRPLTALAASLRRLDTAQSASLAGPVLAAYASRVRASVDADKDTARALYLALCREDKLPLRDILRVFPLALTATPVWIVPPTLVPQVFTPDAVVDLAVLDASAQMPVPLGFLLPCDRLP